MCSNIIFFFNSTCVVIFKKALDAKQTMSRLERLIRT